MSDDRFIITVPEAPLIAPVIDGLFAEYQQRYGNYFGGTREPDPPGIYAPPDGIFIALLRQQRPIATGAFKRLDADTAELKRIWTDGALRRQGLAKRVLAELERHARRLGYREIFLTTGFRQPEAAALYISSGYQPQFDATLDPERLSLPPYDGRLRFRKSLYAGADAASPTLTDAQALTKSIQR